MKKIMNDLNSMIIFNYSHDQKSLLDFFCYLQNNKKFNNYIIYLKGVCCLEEISNQYLNVIYINNIEEIKKYYEFSRLLLKLNKKIMSLILLQEYELLNTENHILYEIYDALEKIYKQKSDVNIFKLKIIKYLETNGKSKIAQEVQKIKTYI